MKISQIGEEARGRVSSPWLAKREKRATKICIAVGLGDGCDGLDAMAMQPAGQRSVARAAGIRLATGRPRKD